MFINEGFDDNNVNELLFEVLSGASKIDSDQFAFP